MVRAATACATAVDAQALHACRAEIRRALAALSIPAEFSRGALYCEGALVIRRSDDGGTAGLTLEGPLSAQFYRVQKLIYDQYQVC